MHHTRVKSCRAAGPSEGCNSLCVPRVLSFLRHTDTMQSLSTGSRWKGSYRTRGKSEGARPPSAGGQSINSFLCIACDQELSTDKVRQREEQQGLRPWGEVGRTETPGQVHQCILRSLFLETPTSIYIVSASRKYPHQAEPSFSHCLKTVHRVSQRCQGRGQAPPPFQHAGEHPSLSGT